MSAIKRILAIAVLAFAVLAAEAPNASATVPSAKQQYMRPVTQTVAQHLTSAVKSPSTGNLRNYAAKQQYTGFNLATLLPTTLFYGRMSLLLRGFTFDQVLFFEAMGIGADLYDASLASLASNNVVNKSSKWCSKGENEAKAYVDSNGSITGRRLLSFETTVSWCLAKRKNGQTYVRVRRQPTPRGDTTTIGALQGFSYNGLDFSDTHMEGNNYYAKYIGLFSVNFLGHHIGDCEAHLTTIIRNDGTVWTSSAGSHC